jgi:hypothetical protein
MDINKTMTVNDAFNRVLSARIGSLSGTPKLAYLYGLRRYATEWLAEVDAAIAKAENAPLIIDDTPLVIASPSGHEVNSSNR